MFGVTFRWWCSIGTFLGECLGAGDLVEVQGNPWASLGNPKMRPSQDGATSNWNHLGKFLKVKILTSADLKWALDPTVGGAVWVLVSFRKGIIPQPKQMQPQWLFKSFAPKDAVIFGRIEVRQMEAQAKHDMEIAFNEKDGAMWPWEKFIKRTSSPWILEHALDLNIKG